MDLTKDDFWTRYGTKQRILRRPYHFKQMGNQKLSSSMKLITQPMMYNSSYGQTLRRIITTADSSLPATTKTKLLNLCTPDVQSSTSPSMEKKRQLLRGNFSTVSGLYLRKKLLIMILKLSQK